MKSFLAGCGIALAVAIGVFALVEAPGPATASVAQPKSVVPAQANLPVPAVEASAAPLAETAAPVTAPAVVRVADKPVVVAQAETPAAPAPAPAAAPAAATGVDDFGLPLGPGHDLTVQKCSACHEVSAFSTQRHTAEQWGDVIGMMIGRGADISNEDFATIQTYLATNLGPK